MTRAEKRRIARQQLHGVLHDGRGRVGHAFQFVMVALILLSVAIIPLEFIPGYQQIDDAVHVIEAIIVGLFTVEFTLRFYASPNRWRYLFSFAGLIDLLSIAPFYAGVFGTEYVRILRVIRLMKLSEIEVPARREEVEAMEREVGLMDGENVEYVVTKTPIVLFLGVLPSIISITFGLGTLLTFEGPIAIAIAVVLFLFAFLFLWKTWLDYSYDVIYVTNYRLVLQNQHILGRSINQVSYASITNVKPFYPGPLSYILRYGSLIIDTAAEHPGQIGLHTVRKHEKAAHVIMQKCFEAQAGFAQPINKTANS